MPFGGGSLGAPGAALSAPPNRYRLESVAKILPSLRVGGLLLELVAFFDMYCHIEVSELLKGFERSMVLTYSGRLTDTLPSFTYSRQRIK